MLVFILLGWLGIIGMFQIAISIDCNSHCFICLFVMLTVLMCFFILSIAAGLYYVAELIEESIVTSAKIIRYLNWVRIKSKHCVIINQYNHHFVVQFVIGIYVCLFLFENLPNYLIICGLISHFNNFIILKSFPFFKLISISFISFIGKFNDNLIFNFLIILFYFSSFGP